MFETKKVNLTPESTKILLKEGEKLEKELIVQNELLKSLPDLEIIKFMKKSKSIFSIVKPLKKNNNGSNQVIITIQK